VADQLPPFIVRVKTLLKSSTGRPGWDAGRQGRHPADPGGCPAGAGGATRPERTPGRSGGRLIRRPCRSGPGSGRPWTGPRTQNNLGIALRRLGERESGTERLEEAVAAYQAALQEWTRERVPLDWAMTQNNLGNALYVASGSGKAALSAWRRRWRLTRRPCRSVPGSGSPWTGP
jgi:hypothetical protein